MYSPREPALVTFENTKVSSSVKHDIQGLKKDANRRNENVFPVLTLPLLPVQAQICG